MADSEINTFVKQFGQAMQALNLTVVQIVSLVLIFVMGLIIGRIAGRLVRKLLSEIGVDRRLKLRIGSVFSIEGIIAGLVSWFFYLSAFLLVLNQLGLMKLVINSVVSVIAIAIAIIIILGLKDLVPNIVAGLRLRNRMDLGAGRKITIGHAQGRIEKADWTGIEMTGAKGEHIIIPYTVAIKHISVGKKKDMPAKAQSRK